MTEPSFFVTPPPRPALHAPPPLAFVVIASAACALAGCDSPAADGDPVLQGTLGKLAFAYECTAPSDPQCDPRSEVAPKIENASFPAIAVGARFDISTRDDEFGNLTTGVQSASDFFEYETDSLAFVALRAGFGTVTATRSGGDVVDLAYLRFDEPVALRILQSAEVGNFESGTIEITPGGVSGSVKTSTLFTFRVVPENANGELLAGAFPVEWTNSNPAVLSFGQSKPKEDNIVVLESKAPGTSEISVKLGKLEAKFNVEVAP